MLYVAAKKQICSELKAVLGELEDVLNLSVRASQFDPVVIPQERRSELKAMTEDLRRIILDIEARPPIKSH